MSPLEIGLLIGIVTIVVLCSGIPIAFGLGVVSLAFLAIFQGVDSFSVLGETFFAGMNEFSLVSIPMFILLCEF